MKALLVAVAVVWCGATPVPQVPKQLVGEDGWIAYVFAKDNTPSVIKIPRPDISFNLAPVHNRIYPYPVVPKPSVIPVYVEQPADTRALGPAEPAVPEYKTGSDIPLGRESTPILPSPVKVENTLDDELLPAPKYNHDVDSDLSEPARVLEADDLKPKFLPEVEAIVSDTDQVKSDPTDPISDSDDSKSLSDPTAPVLKSNEEPAVAVPVVESVQVTSDSVEVVTPVQVAAPLRVGVPQEVVTPVQKVAPVRVSALVQVATPVQVTAYQVPAAVASPVVVAVPPEPLNAPEPPMPSVGEPFVGGQFHTQDELKQYSFGHWGGPNTRVEVKDSLGRVSGSFAYVNPDGDVQVRKYAAAPAMGFKVAASDLPEDTQAVAQVKAAHAQAHADAKAVL